MKYGNKETNPDNTTHISKHHKSCKDRPIYLLRGSIVNAKQIYVKLFETIHAGLNRSILCKRNHNIWNTFFLF